MDYTRTAHRKARTVTRRTARRDRQTSTAAFLAWAFGL